MRRYYLGVSVSGHDPAFAIVDDGGHVLFAEATERYLQDKRALGALPDNLQHLVGPLSHFCAEASSFTIARSWFRAKAAPSAVTPSEDHAQAHAPFDPISAQWLCDRQAQAFAGVGSNVALLTGCQDITVTEFDHHLCHATFACVSAPFQEGVCVVIDGEGEVGSSSTFDFTEAGLKRRQRSWGPGSLGGFYAWLTLQCGFQWWRGEEWKVMGLAAFGRPDDVIIGHLDRLLTIKEGTILKAPAVVWNEVEAALEPYRRSPDAPVELAANLAASGQAMFARWADALLRHHLPANGPRNLVLTGGCALNSAYTGTLRANLGFDQVHVPGAPADDGNAVGAALLAWQADHPGARPPRLTASAYLGSTPCPRVLDRLVAHCGLPAVERLPPDDLSALVELLRAGAIVGVMRGRAEFGPRSLGNRSILADPTRPEMKDLINRAIKNRESYRPFAPAIPEEFVADWFEDPQPSPFMSLTLRWRPEQAARVPAVVHADGTGRLQTVSASTNLWFHRLLGAFGQASGVPILLNTSFNIMGKPIVHSVEDAIGMFMTSGLDALVVEDVLIRKKTG